jgi:hypothetical protein
MKNIEEMTFEELVDFAKHTDDSIAQAEEAVKAGQELLNLMQEQKAKIAAKLLVMVKERNIKDEKVNDLFVTYFSKEDITWLDDAGLLKKLQENGANEFIKVVTKTTTSIDKNALKKAFKTNEALKESYKNFYGTKLTEYVAVTTEENHSKMLEHIEEGYKK